MGDYQHQLFTKPMAHRHRHHYLLLLIFHLFAAFSILSEARCLENHRHALLQLKARLNFSAPLRSWTNATDSDCCVGWYGVTCNPVSAGEVTSLNLNKLYLRGVVDPDALFTLSNLTTLNLAFNYLNFSDVVSSPGAFEQLHRLTVLNLSYSGFLGQIPMGISTLTNLVSLDFSTIHLSSVVVLKQPNLDQLIRHMKYLRKLYLDGVDLSSDGFDWGRALSESHRRLAELSLRACNLSGPGDASLAKLRSLTLLRLDQNNLTSVDYGFLGNLSSLETLGLSRCSLTGSIPEGIFRLSNLTSLDMSNNPLLGGSLPEMDRSLMSLESLKLSNCKLSGHIPSSIGKLSGLTELDLSGNNLSGKLPPELESRSSILVISLANNNLTGSIPSSYGNFSSLTVLDIQNNSLTGQIPSSLFSLPSLKTLRLQQNNLSHNLVMASHSAAPLETVDLSNNNFQGSIPSAVFNLSSLKILSLARNNFSGEVKLNRLAGLRNLSSLDLSYNRLTVMESESSDASRKNSAWPSISTLKLASCNLTTFPLFLKDQENLQYLDLSLNRIAGNIPRWLWKIGGTNSSLIHLNLSHNILSGFEEPLFDPLTNPLKIIDLHSNRLKGSFLRPPVNNSLVDYSNNNLSSKIPENISQFLNYTVFFSISNNNFSGKIPPQICESSFYLQVLDVSLNSLSGSVPPCLAQIPKLSVLNLRGNNFSDTIPSNFPPNCTLRTLNLNGNQLSGNVPASLRNCQKLEVLDLGYNTLDGGFPDFVGNLSNLRVLVLRSNRFGGPVDARSGSFERLQIVDLSYNNFNGSLSRQPFSNMKAMMITEENSFQPAVQSNYLHGLYYRDTVMITTRGLSIRLEKILSIYTSIDVSNNRFVGSIPDGIGKLNALAFLNASSNFFSGVIPRSIGNLKQLQSLDMSKNQLSGQIPRELVGLSFLSVLDLSDNNLSGAIPRGKQFNTFKENSFLGNPGLCGYPLENMCSDSTASNRTKSSMSCPPGEPKWLFIFVGFGLGGGLALAFGPLLSNKKWREVFNGHVDRLLVAIFPSCFWKWVSCGGDEDDTEGKVEEESDWVDEGREHPFCIFCTGLEFISGQAVICHRECSCTRRDSR